MTPWHHRPAPARRAADAHPDVPTGAGTARPRGASTALADATRDRQDRIDQPLDRLPPAVASAVLLGIVFVLTISSVVLAPKGSSVAAWWPAGGVSVAALMRARDRQRWGLGVGLFVVSVVGNLIGDRPLGISLGFALANLAETVVVTLLLIRAGGARSALASMAGFGRFLQACTAGAAVIAVGAGATVQLSGTGDFDDVARAVGASHGAALLLVLPWFLGTPPPPRRRRTERVAQWLALLAVVSLVFAPGQSLPLAFAPFVPLMWGAVRMGQRTVFAQLVTTGVVATLLSAGGGGPFAHVSAGHPPEVITALVQAFIVCAALLVLPLSVAIRQRQDAVAELERSEALFRHGFNGARVGMLLLQRGDGVLRVVELNAVALALLTGGDGRTEADVLGRSWSALLDPMSALEVDGVVHGSAVSVLREGESSRGWQGEVQVARPSRAWLEVTLSPLDEYGGDLYTAQLVDVTERREAEAQLRSALDKERKAVERLTELDQAKDDFVTNISHELRTPITSVIGYAEMLSAGDAGELTRLQLGMVDKVERNAGRLLALIEDVLAVARVDAGSFSFTTTEVDVVQSAWQACEALEKMAGDAEVTLTVVAPQVPVVVTGDVGQLERALLNLASNAVKFTPSGGRVTVRVTETPDDRVEIAVEDTGMGVPESESHRLFERFFRSSTAQAEAIQGTGLGLTIVNSIAHAHHGDVRYEPGPDGGSVFTISLPLAGAGSVGALAGQVQRERPGGPGPTG